jgi:hypothetical protein
MNRFVAEGVFSTAASSAPGKKLRSKIVWTDRASMRPSAAGLAISPAPLKVGLVVAIEAPPAGRDPSAYRRLEDGMNTTLS